MDHLADVLLGIEKAHTVPQRTCDCGGDLYIINYINMPFIMGIRRGF